MSYFLCFKYNEKGRGNLALWLVDTIIAEIEARTGSINNKGELVNSIEPGTWRIKDPPIDTINPSMMWDEVGWWARLYTDVGESSHYGIHPDGGDRKGNGTKGCIGTQGSAIEFRDYIKKILLDYKQVEIEVHISKGENL